MALSAGMRLGPYEILSALGAGGMGEVYRAKDLRLNREVAIKVLPAAFSNDSERLRRFEQEAQAAGALNHPNILAVYDVGTHDGMFYVVSELLEGETLRNRLAESPIPARKAIDYAIQIARGLAAAHAKRIVHRDLKPENLFVTTDGQIKILDFGLAKMTTAKAAETTNAATEAMGTQPGVVMGTVGYMSPEQVRGQVADGRSDIFSLGVILYEMLSGKRAFQGESSVDTMSAILKEDPPELPATLPAALDRIIRRAMEKKPEERFESARDVAFALETISGTSEQQKTLETVDRPPRRFIGVAVAAALACALAAGVYLGRQTVRTSTPAFHQLTFRRGWITNARFAPDGHTIVYGATWEGNAHDLYTARIEFPESRSLGLPAAGLFSISAKGEMAIAAECRLGSYWKPFGALARVPLSGGAPRVVLKDVYEADWAPDSDTLAVVHMAGGLQRLEYPLGKVLYATSGWISFPRFSPKGDRIAFLDHPLRFDNRGSVTVVDLAGNKITLSSGWEALEGLVWGVGGTEIWFGAAESGFPNSIYAVSLSGKQRLVARLPGGLTLQDMGPDGRVLLSLERRRWEMFGLAAGEKRERNLTWLDVSLPADVSADGKKLLFTDASAAAGPNYAVCVRNTDGSPVVRLGEGLAMALSPDGKLAMALVHRSPPQLVLLPTGEGEPRVLPQSGMVYLGWGAWLPDEGRIVFAANEVGREARVWLQNLEGGKPQPVSPEGTGTGGLALSPDGKVLAATDRRGQLALYQLEGGDARPAPGFEQGDRLIGWSGDGRSLYVYNPEVVSARIYRLDLRSGKKDLWREIRVGDPAGVGSISGTVVSADSKTCVYGVVRTLSELYLVEGLR
jgi:eukaryotic-like serine/threonine-protein kinase